MMVQAKAGQAKRGRPALYGEAMTPAQRQAKRRTERQVVATSVQESLQEARKSLERAMEGEVGATRAGSDIARALGNLDYAIDALTRLK